MKKVLLKHEFERRGGIPLKPLKLHQLVRVQSLRKIGRKPNWKKRGQIVKVDLERDSYDVQLDSGEIRVRNRVFLKPISSVAESDDSSDSELSESPDYATDS